MAALRVGWLQMDLAWESPATNIARVEALLGAHRADVWVLPEMWSTGFTMNTALAEGEAGPAYRAMQRWAAERQALLIGSLQVRIGDKARNRLYAVFPNGQVASYDKRHLFRMASEHAYYEAGTQRLLVEWQGWRIAPLICYDLRFPVWSRRTPEYDYDLLIYVANWPSARHAHWTALLPARAIENQAYTLGVNRIGTDGNRHTYAGGSVLLDPKGEVILHAGSAEGAFVATIDIEALRTYRERFPAWQDADKFEILPTTAWG